jgi:hypothetical protein
MIVRTESHLLFGAQDRLVAIAQDQHVAAAPADGENLEFTVVPQDLAYGLAMIGECLGTLGAEERQVEVGIKVIPPGVIAGKDGGSQETPALVGLRCKDRPRSGWFHFRSIG